MDANTFSKLQQSLLKVGRDIGEDYEVDGVRVKTEFYTSIRHDRDRYTIWFDGQKVGHVDMVVPFNFLKSPYEVYVLWELASASKADWIKVDKVNWEELYYPPDDGQDWKMPVTLSIEAAVEVWKRRAKPLDSQLNSATVTTQ